MHVARIIEPGPFGLTPGTDYLLDDVAASQYLVMGQAAQLVHLSRASIHPIVADPLPRGLDLEDLRPAEAHSLLIVRAGGFGDILLLTPALAELRRRLPGLRITLATAPGYETALDTSHPALAGIATTPYPVPVAQLREFTHLLPLENVVEGHPGRCASTLFAQALGLLPWRADPATTPTPSFSLRPLYQRPPQPVLDAAWQMFLPKLTPGKVPMIGIQTEASALCRTYPVTLLEQVIQKLMARLPRAHIVLFGRPASTRQTSDSPGHPRLTSLPCLPVAPDFAQSIALLAQMEVLIAPDSALTHLAGALEIPCIALFGPFHWQERTAWCPTTRALQGTAPCAPCHHHVTRWQHWPAGKPCNTTGHCLALASLTPDRIVAATLQRLPSP